jgi:hypothetical protein
MSVVIATKFPVPVETLLKVFAGHQDMMMAISADSRGQGAVHHQFAEDPDGSAMAIDEWPDEEAFRRFFDGQEDIKKVMAAAGVASAPDVTVYRLVDTPDRF